MPPRGRPKSTRFQSVAEIPDQPPSAQGRTTTNAVDADAVPPPNMAQPVTVTLPVVLVQELRDLLRDRNQNLARNNDRLTQLEDQVASQRANTVLEQRRRNDGMPVSRANPSRVHRSPPRRQLIHRSPPEGVDKEEESHHQGRPHLLQTIHIGPKSPRTKNLPMGRLAHQPAHVAVPMRGLPTIGQRKILRSKSAIIKENITKNDHVIKKEVTRA